ncbi:MAG TPA: competence/damage-inducible protein A [Calditrichaeota bacterium]|nr:competence/damage-inducible protein A [Calditrichota bacterium]
MDSIKAEIISIGNEILAGYTVNTNATFISQQLMSIGLPVGWISTISDNHDDILNALGAAMQRAQVVLVTGGLGPTPDDITKKVICEFFKTEMVFNSEVFEDVQTFLRARGADLNQANRDQALVPAAAKIIRNKIGTAPGLMFQKKGIYFFFMPGVPAEMKYITHKFIVGFLAKELNLPKVHNRLLRTTGIAEAKLYERLKDILDSFPQCQPAFLPRHIGVDLRFRLISDDEQDLRRFEQFISAIKERTAKYIFADRPIELEERLGEILVEKKLTLAVAESFTGGLLSNLLTDISGSSRYFLGAAVTYSNESKMQLLGVQDDTLAKYGAVSEATVLEMLKGVQKSFGSHCAIATTGIAGPTGATPGKPVGLCYIAARYGNKTAVREFRFGTDRIINKRRGAVAGMEMLRRLLLNL